MKKIEIRSIHGKKVKFFVMVWSCANCDREGVIRVPGTSAGDTMIKMSHADHEYLSGGKCDFKGHVGFPT